MLPTEREAKHTIAGNEYLGWSAMGRVRKLARQMPLTPEEESPRHRAPRSKKKRHVHKWSDWVVIGQVPYHPWVRRESGSYVRGQVRMVNKRQRRCERCGLRENEGVRWY